MQQGRLNTWVSFRSALAPKAGQFSVGVNTHLKKRFWGRHLWARGYFCATVGQMSEEMIKQYLERHFEPNPNDNFRAEPPARDAS